MNIQMTPQIFPSQEQRIVGDVAAQLVELALSLAPAWGVSSPLALPVSEERGFCIWESRYAGLGALPSLDTLRYYLSPGGDVLELWQDSVWACGRFHLDTQAMRLSALEFASELLEPNALSSWGGILLELAAGVWRVGQALQEAPGLSSRDRLLSSQACDHTSQALMRLRREAIFMEREREGGVS